MASIPPDVRAVLRTLTERGHKVWLVGGALRDAFLGIQPKDWDLATTAHPDQVMPLFPHVVPLGIRHGTVQVHTGERAIEITSLGDTGEEGIVRDLGRRDFTLNAMALAYPDGSLLDLHGGRRDLQTGTLRGVRDPAARFREDPLRTLRVGRLVSVYGFHLEEWTRRALTETACELDSVAPERIREEVYRLLTGDHVEEGIAAMREGGVWQVVLPELDRDAIFEHAAAVTSTSPARLRLRLAAFLHGVGCPERSDCGGGLDGAHRYPCFAAAEQSASMAEGALVRWRASHRDTREVGHIIRHQLPPSAARWTDGALRRWLAALGPGFLEDCLDLARAEALVSNSGSALDGLETLRLRVSSLLRQNPPLTIRQLAVTGGDVMRVLHLDPGPLVGRLLRRLHDRVLEDPDRNTAAALFDLLEQEYRHLKQNGDAR